HDFDELLSGESGALNECESFREGLHLDGEKRVHREFDGLSSAVRSKVKKFLAHRAQNRLCGFEGCGIAANHENELALFRAPGTAGNRRIEEAEASGRGCRGAFSSESRPACTWDNGDAAFLPRGKRSLVAG